MDQPIDKPSVSVSMSVDASSAVEGFWKARSAAFFALHEELVALDDELDIMYRGQL